MGLTVGSKNARGWYRLRLNDLEILGKADLGQVLHQWLNRSGRSG